MDTTLGVSLTGPFLQAVGELVADLKRQEIARLDLDTLNLKRSQLAEKLDDFKAELASSVKEKKASAINDLISRGLSNSTVRDNMLRAIEQDANREIDKATREYNRAVEEIAIMEQRVAQESENWWRKLLRYFGFRSSC